MSFEYLSSPSFFWGIQNSELVNSPNFSGQEQNQRMENAFCRDFSCCGLKLDDLHSLLNHYEEYHMTHELPHSHTTDDQELRKLQHQVPQEPNKVITDPSILENPLHIQTIDTPVLSPTSSDQIDDDTCQIKSTSTNDSEDESIDRPYRCDVKGCDKAYKNANGLKYHRLHGHCPPNELDVNKPFVCSFLDNCRKRYKNLNGLKYHIEHTHSIKLALTSDMFIKSQGIKRRLSSSELE